ncbi:MAG: tetratricopeptide repeat protein [Methanobrevibacter sp.]|nr:tetratricopeptide repeat protein [Methanobrevibacter sp.]
MPILSFSSQDIDIITGKKTITIRKLWKTPLKRGDRLYCYWNLVSKEKKKIFEAIVEDVDQIKYKDLKNNDELAKKEGYENANEMVKDFKKKYVDKIKDNDDFQIIYFKKLDVDDWKGDKIDEKAMITQRADILFDSGKYDKSTLCYNAALKIDPDDVYLLNKQGDNLSRLGKFQDAIKCYDKALVIEHDNEYIINNKAIALLNSGDVDGALEASDDAIKANPNSPIVLYWRGFILEVLRKYDAALEVYDKLIMIDSENPEVWNARGNLLTDMGMPNEAIDSYNRAVKLSLDDSEMDANALNRMGNAYIDLGQMDKALECYNAAIDIEKDNIDFLLNKGVVLMELHKFEEAVASFDKVLLKNPDNEDAFFLKEECLDNF